MRQLNAGKESTATAASGTCSSSSNSAIEAPDAALLRCQTELYKAHVQLEVQRCEEGGGKEAREPR